MLEAVRTRVRSAAMIGIAAALVVAGLAFAAGDGGDSGSGDGSSRRATHPPLPPPPILADRDRNLTWAEFHYQKDGEAKVTRLDRGEVVSAADDSLTISENDGNEVTIPVDGETRVFAGPDKDVEVDDLDPGQEVVVSRLEGGAADVIGVPPTRAEIEKAFKAHGFRAGAPVRPPPGVPGKGFTIPLPPPRGCSGQ
jgi:hypothetical protein